MYIKYYIVLEKLFLADKCIYDLNLFRCGNKIFFREDDLRNNSYSFNLVTGSIYRNGMQRSRDVTLIYTYIRVLVHCDF